MEYLRGRTMLCRKTEVFPIEAIVRGYLVGSGWKEYQKSGTLAGQPLPANIPLAGMLPEARFTPSTKAESGHDENITYEQMSEKIGKYNAEIICDSSLRLYQEAWRYALSRNVIIADTKFEWGQTADGKILLIDEVLTPDSSRFWDAALYESGTEPKSFDKDGVRSYYRSAGFTGEGIAPIIPEEVIQDTRDRYIEAFTRLVGAKPIL
jgi:phosphoribosylaminoimidazole-succinocarboxamide synthase